MKKTIIGLDRIDINNVHLCKVVDSTKLCKKEVTPPIKFKNGSSSISYLKIADSKKFSLLLLGRKYKAPSHGIISFSPKNLWGDNLNLLNMDSIRAHLSSLEAYIVETYGLQLDFSEARFKTMELSSTIELDYPFRDYVRPLLVCFQNMHRCLKKYHESLSCSDSPTSFLETIYSGNKSIKLSVYDKKQELIDHGSKKSSDQKKYADLPNMARVEFTLKSSVKIKDVFGDDHVSTLTDDAIQNAFAQCVMYYYVAPFVNWKKKNHAFLKRAIQKSSKPSGQHWRDNLLTSFRNNEIMPRTIQLLDIDDYYNAEKDAIRPYRRKHISLLDNDPFIQHGNERLLELFDKAMSPWSHQENRSSLQYWSEIKKKNGEHWPGKFKDYYKLKDLVMAASSSSSSEDLS